ncbi:unnamed protein product [Acanthoscelides obtectus]|uniref:BHLH domain-containing protein n=1 Tax=Acanthoscelides obtectus TaxID=200917 RepID=A0A9P0K8T2_ACAOB|nr:unnamed protein product [Acanthoscelides obtectus]CAK1662526.1 Transcription factor 15 [Acanthoscelides obtectus]
MEFMQYRPEQSFAKTTIQGKRKKQNNVRSQDEDAGTVRQRSQANARERDRTHSVNTAFSTLRTLIPTEPKDRKLSKIETLRLASSYINHLGAQLMAGPIDQPCLRLQKPSSDDDSSRPHTVCTFCIARKNNRSFLTEEYECSSFEGQIYLAPMTATLNVNDFTNSSLDSSNELTSMFC